MGERKIRKTTITVHSFDGGSEKFKERRYSVDASNFTTVLDALIKIKETMDPSLSFRYSCRMGICGSCAMVVDGKPSLACETKIFDIDGRGEGVTVKAMQGHPLLRGLVTDFDDFFQKHKEVFPWIIRHNVNDKFDDSEAFHQTDKQVNMFLPFAECIKCGLCIDACPVENTNKNFMGPQALSQAYRYIADSKDQGRKYRIEALDTLDGAWGCEFSGSCSKVCPKSVDPALAIQLLKADIAKYRLTKK
jgi:succinate dehydrogenase / fumarate reductase, iron-sulfur subunit